MSFSKDKFAERLEKARKEKGYKTQKSFVDTLVYDSNGEKITVSCRTYRKWLKGDCSPCLARLVQLADALDVSIDYLLGRDKPEDK